MSEPVRDIAHLSHIELLTPKPEESLFYFRELLGMEVAGESGDSLYLRCFGDYERSSLKLTASPQVGRRASRLPHAFPGGAGATGRGPAGRRGRGRAGWRAISATAVPTASSTPMVTASSCSTSPSATRLPRSCGRRSRTSRNRYPGRGVGVRHLDHVNFLAVDPGANRVFCERYLGLRLTEQIVLDDGNEAGVWLASNQKSYDLTYTRDVTGTRGRLHHIAFFVDQREDVLRAADIFLEHGIVMESGPHKHAIQQTFFLYTYEPGGNRIEVCAGGFLIFDPEHEAVVWTQAERAKGQAWGMQTVASFHIKGTPPVPEEEVLLARSAGH